MILRILDFTINLKKKKIPNCITKIADGLNEKFSVYNPHGTC